MWGRVNSGYAMGWLRCTAACGSASWWDLAHASQLDPAALPVQRQPQLITGQVKCVLVEVQREDQVSGEAPPRSVGSTAEEGLALEGREGQACGGRASKDVLVPMGDEWACAQAQGTSSKAGHCMFAVPSRLTIRQRQRCVPGAQVLTWLARWVRLLSGQRSVHFVAGCHHRHEHGRSRQGAKSDARVERMSHLRQHRGARCVYASASFALWGKSRQAWSGGSATVPPWHGLLHQPNSEPQPTPALKRTSSSQAGDKPWSRW